MLPLVFGNIVGLVVALASIGIWALGRSTPDLLAAWRSRVTTWLGRVALMAMALLAAGGLVRDGSTS